MLINRIRATSGFGLVMTACILAGTALAAAPAVSINTANAEITVEIDDAFKPFAGLTANCLAEGRTWAAQISAEANKERPQDTNAIKEKMKYTFDRVYTLRSVVGPYVSLVRSDGTFEGGAHPNQVIDTILWDANAQKRISIRPFFNETADNGPTMKALAQQAKLAVAAEKIARDIPVGSDDKLKPGTTPEQYLRQDTFIGEGVEPALLKVGPVTLAPSTETGKSSGLTFHYSPYAVGPYAEGPYTVFVPWTAFAQYLSDEGKATFGGTRPKRDDKG
jgi:hypothetical protein